MSTEMVRPEHNESSIERWPMGSSIMHRLRKTLNDPDGPFPGAEDGVNVFQRLYLEERDACIPDEFIGEEILDDIHSLFYYPLEALRQELAERVGRQQMMLIAIDPSWQDTTLFVIHTGQRVVFSGGLKAWNLWWESEDAMAEEFDDWYQRAVGSLPEWQMPEVDAEGFLVSLRLQRTIHVATNDREEAVSRALSWEHNENDPDVQLLLEEIDEYRCGRIAPDVADVDLGDGTRPTT